MKGQAFVGLPSEKSAEKALRDTNGYVLYDKPLVVVSFFIPSLLRRSAPGSTYRRSFSEEQKPFDGTERFGVCGKDALRASGFCALHVRL